MTLINTNSKWRLHAREVIQATLAALDRDEPGATRLRKRQALRAAYPFDRQLSHPYQMWLKEVRLVIGEADKPRSPEPQVTITAAGVLCTWCFDRCIVCLPARKQYERWVAGHTEGERQTWAMLERAAAEDPAAKLALADWLEEQGFGGG